MPDTTALGPDIAHLIDVLLSELDNTADADALYRQTRWIVEQLLRREQDQVQCRQTMAVIDHFFAMQPAPGLADLHRFCKQVVMLAVEKRPSRVGTLGETAPPAAESSEPVEVDDAPGDDIVPPPYPTRHDSFGELLAAALVYRVRHLTTFFQRRKGGLQRETLPPFLLSPEFDRRFETVIVDHIAPAMMKIPRFTGSFEDARPWKRVNTEEFWAIVAEGEGMEERLLATWRSVWNDLKPRRDDKSGKLMAPSGLARIRKILAPGEPPAYAMAKVGGDMINLFVRLLSDLHGELEGHWSILADIYDQEFDRRSFQDRSRVGAMMDAITNLFPSLPGRLGEFVAILCHYNMRGIDTAFLRQVVDASAGTVFLAGFLAPSPAVAWIADDVAGIHISYQVGIVAGYTSYLGIDEANHTAVVVLQNAFNWDCSAGHQLLLMLADRGNRL